MTSISGTVPSRPVSRSGNGDEKNGTERMHSKRLCSDWLVSYESNFSVAKDREWLTSYTPFESYVLDHKGSLMEVLGIGSVTLPVMRSNSDPLDDENSTKKGEVTLQEVLHVPKAACNVVSRHDRVLGRQELWMLPDEEDPYKRGVFQHRRGKHAGLENMDVSVYIPPNSGSLCLLGLDLDSPPTGYALAPTSFPGTDGHVNGSPKSNFTYSGDLIPRTWPTNQRERWIRRKETGEDDLCVCEPANATATGATGPRIKTAELVKKLMDQRAGLISQLKTLDELIDEVQGVIPPPAAATSVNSLNTIPATPVSMDASLPSSMRSASTANAEPTPTSTNTPSISELVDHSEVCHGGGDTTQTPDFARVTTKEEKRAMAEQEAMTEVDAMEWEETIAEAMEWEECPAEAESMEESTAEAEEVAEEELMGEEQVIVKEEVMIDEEAMAKEEVMADETEKGKAEDKVEENEARWETQSEVQAKQEAQVEKESQVQREAQVEEESQVEEEAQVEEKVEKEEEAQWETESEEEAEVPGEAEERGRRRCKDKGGKGREKVKAGEEAQVEEKVEDDEEAQWETQSEEEVEEEPEETEAEEETRKEEESGEEVEEEADEEVNEDAEVRAEEEAEQEVDAPEPEANTEEKEHQKVAFHMTAAQAAEAAHWFTPSPVANHTTPAKAAESAQRFTPLTIANGTTPAEAIKPGQWSYPLVGSTVWYDTPPAEAAESETGLVPFSTLGFFVDSDLDKGICSTWLTITSEGEYKKKTWCYGWVKKNKLSEHEKAWLKAIRNYRPRFARFFENLGYDPNWDKWEPERGGVQDRAHARTLVKWFRVHAHPPPVHGGEIMVDLDAGIEDDCGLGEAKERLRALRAAGLERSVEARGENIFIQNTTLYLRKLKSEGVEPHFKDISGARWWKYEEIFGDY